MEKNVYNIFEHISCEGILIKSDNLKEETLKKIVMLYKRLFAGMFACQIYFSPEYYEIQYLPIENEAKKINLNIVGMPVNNAWYDIKDNTINISVYTIEQTLKLYNFTKVELLEKIGDSICLDDYVAILNNSELRKKGNNFWKNYWKKECRIYEDENGIFIWNGR